MGKEWIQKNFYGKTLTIVQETRKTEDFACLMLEPDDSFFERETEVEDFKDDSGKVWPSVKVRTVTSEFGNIFMVSFNQYQQKKNVTLAEEFQFGGFTYKVYAVAIHFGSHMGGHYAAVVCRKGKWYLIDDVQVSEVPKFEPKSPNCAAEKSASQIACAATSPSEWPSTPISPGQTRVANQS